jgi:translocation and assembly module TamB
LSSVPPSPVPLPAPRAPRRWRPLALVVAAVALSLASAGAALGVLLRTDAGSAWVLQQVPGLQVEQPQGRLFGGAFSTQRVTLAAGARPVVLHGLAWRDTHWAWRPHDGAWIGLHVHGPSVQRVEVGASTDTTPASPPRSLRLPLALLLDGLAVGRIDLDGHTLASDLSARIELGHGHGSEHRVEQLALRTALARVQGRLQIGADAPFAVDATLAARSADGATWPWQAQARARGPLAALDVQAGLTSPRSAGAQLDAQATLAPYAAWPLAALQARATDIDLAGLVQGAPQTRLSGKATVDTRAIDQPMAARVTLANALPGAWSAQRLPLQALDIDIAGRADRPDRLDVQRFDLRLPGDGGRVTGQGHWHADAARLVLALQGVRPAAADARAPAMTLAGTLTLDLQGLPAPDGSRPAAATQRLRAEAALDGRQDGPRGQAARVRGTVQAEQDAGAWRVQLDGLDATAGTAQIKGQVTAERSRANGLRVAGEGQAQGFDPSLWWAAAPRAQIDARAQLRLTAPPSADWPLRSVAAWQALRGQARVELLGPSQVSGVPLQGTLTADGREPGWAVDVDLRAATSTARLQGRLAPRADDDRWRLAVDAPALAALKPLLAALRTGPVADGLAGSLAADMQVLGRWPALRTQGSLRADTLRAGAVGAQRLAARWQAGPDRAAALAVTIDGERVALGDAGFDTLRASVDGSLAAHTLALDASTALRPPAWTDALTGSGAAQGSRVKLRADGRWLAAPATTPAASATSAIAPARGAAPGPLAGQWQARVSELDARDRDAAQPWFSARDVAVQATLDDAGALVQAGAAAGRASLLGAAVTWRDARFAAARNGQPAQMTLDAELEPLAVAPWLARLQPDAGFGGDLTVKGRVVVKHQQAFDADIVLERAGGDLAVTTDGVTQPLGLTDLRLAMAASDGTWHFTQAVAGANLGVLAGAQSLRVSPQATWPAPQTPMQGVLEWRVADLGVWAPFTPPGWRVGGMLRTSAALGGRFGAPEIEGRMEGSGLALRNLLQGVDLRDGELALSLRGIDARIERFEFKGGDGTLRLAGGATLGADPVTNLQLVAQRFRVLGRADRRIVASGEATLALDRSSLALEGRFSVDEGLIDVSRGDAPSLDDDITVRGGRHAQRPAPPASTAGTDAPDSDAATPARRSARPVAVRLGVQVDLGRQLRLRGRGLDTRLAGVLAVSAPGGRLALNGQVSAQDGSYAAYGQKLEIERGVVSFVGPAENPRLDIFAVRPNLDVKVGVLVGGTAQAPRVRLVSEPEMSDYDKLSWLVLGRASDGLARADTALLQRAALAILAGENESPDAVLLANLGLDELSVRQDESGELRETVVTVGKQLSRRWYVGYERGVNSTTGTWQLIYRAAQRFTLRAQSGADNSLDAIWTWRWN